MKQYLKAEFALCKKNRANFIIGACALFVYCLLLLFSGVGGVSYAASISLVGFVTVLFFMIPWFLSASSFFQNRKKICVSAEHMALMLGESKRMFVKTKIVVCIGHCLLMLGVIAVMQIPACLIAGEDYTLLVFGTEVMAVLGFSLLSMAVLFVCPSHRLALGIPFWCGFCGGLAGGTLSNVHEFTDKSDALDMYIGIAIAGGIVFTLAVLYRYIKTVREERRGLPKKPATREE